MKQQQQNIHSAIELLFVTYPNILRNGISRYVSLQSKEFLSFYITFLSTASPLAGLFYLKKIFYSWVVFALYLLFRTSGIFFLLLYVVSFIGHWSISTQIHIFSSLPLVCIVIHLFFPSLETSPGYYFPRLQLSTPIITGTIFLSWIFYFSVWTSIIVTGSRHGGSDCSDCCSALVVEIPRIHACCSLEYWRHLSEKWEIMLWGICQLQRYCDAAGSFNISLYALSMACHVSEPIVLLHFVLYHHVFIPSSMFPSSISSSTCFLKIYKHTKKRIE